MLLAWLAVLTDSRAQVLVPDEAIEFEHDTARTMAGEVVTYFHHARLGRVGMDR